LNFWVTDEQLQFLQRAAKQSGMVPGKFNRNAALNEASKLLGEPAPSSRSDKIDLSGLTAEQKAAIAAIVNGGKGAT